MSAETRRFLMIACAASEMDWLRHAARLRGVSVAEYVLEAVNVRLCKEGVDAVLFRVASDEVMR